jgi:hypothetical protein
MIKGQHSDYTVLWYGRQFMKLKSYSSTDENLFDHRPAGTVEYILWLYYI